MTAKWTETTETTVPARVEREETEIELWTHKRSAYRCVKEPATPTEIGRGLQALEPAERAEALTAAGVEPTPPATPEEIGEVLAGLEPDERDRAFNAAGVPSATPEELAAVVAALSHDDRLRVLRALGAKPAPERTPEALGAELAALDVCEFLRAARAAGIVEARRVPRSSSPPLSVGGIPVAWSEVTITSVGGGGGASGGNGGGLPLSPLAEAQAALREAQRENIATARALDHWRERATAAEHAEREATATADRAQLEAAAVATRLEDTTRILKRVQGERDEARAERDDAIRDRDLAGHAARFFDETRFELCAEPGETLPAAARRTARSLASAVDGLIRLRAELAEVTQARDVAHAQLVTELGRVRELATERDQARAELAKARALGPVEPRDVVETAGGRGCARLTERDGSTVKVTAGVGYCGVRGAAVKVTGSVWFENVLVAAHRAGVLL